jgi:hypothetical protein
VICLVLEYPFWGSVSFPIACELYLRQDAIDRLKGKYKTLQFSPKTEVLVKMFNRLKPYFAGFDKRIELIVDGGYTKKSVLVLLSQEENICVITRVRKDAKLFDLPPPREKGQRSRPNLKSDKICMNL